MPLANCLTHDRVQYNPALDVAPRATFIGFVAKKHHSEAKMLETGIHIRQNKENYSLLKSYYWAQ